MEITINERGMLQLERVFNPIVLKSGADEEIIICMRDSGFEFEYQGNKYEAKGGSILKTSNII